MIRLPKATNKKTRNNILSFNNSTKTGLFAALFMLIFSSGCGVQVPVQLESILNKAGVGTTLTPYEIQQGLKHALEIGTQLGTDRLSAKDGFAGNMAVKILFPPEAQKVESALRSIGLGKLADNVIRTVNKAAEDAVMEAKPIFLSAIRQMTITDATRILLGNQDAATTYFKQATTPQLIEKFKPVISGSLNKVGATKYWGDVASKYNLIAKQPINTDLAAYVTQKAIDGLFIEIATEELKIRTNLAARNTALLQRVFGYADKNK